MLKALPFPYAVGGAPIAAVSGCKVGWVPLKVRPSLMPSADLSTHHVSPALQWGVSHQERAVTRAHGHPPSPCWIPASAPAAWGSPALQLREVTRVLLLSQLWAATTAALTTPFNSSTLLQKARPGLSSVWLLCTQCPGALRPATGQWVPTLPQVLASAGEPSTLA
jgi:hypothetical protein